MRIIHKNSGCETIFWEDHSTYEDNLGVKTRNGFIKFNS